MKWIGVVCTLLAFSWPAIAAAGEPVAQEEDKPDATTGDAPADAQNEIKWDSTPPASAEVARIQAVLLAGEHDRALEEAQALYAEASEEEVKTDALRIMAEALRKQGKWSEAGAAYTRLAKRFEKKSDAYIQYDAIAQILRVSPNGFYLPARKSGDAAGEEPATLDDDAVLAEALACLADTRALKLKRRVMSVTRARTSKDVVAALAPLAEAYRQARLLAPDRATDDEQKAAQAGAAQLAKLARPNVSSLRATLQQYKPKMESPWNVTNAEKEDIAKWNARCRQLAETESAFNELLGKMGGPKGWSGRADLISDSDNRYRTYESLAEEFTVPAWRRIRL